MLCNKLIFIWSVIQVEETMKNTVRSTIGDALADIGEKSRNVWVLEWPGQVVIVGSQTAWTAGVENGIHNNSLTAFYLQMLDMVSQQNDACILKD